MRTNSAGKIHLKQSTSLSTGTNFESHTESFYSACLAEPAIVRKKIKMADEENQESPERFEHDRPASVLPGALFITGVTFASIVGGFGYAIGQARRRSSEAFDARTQEGVKLALRALGWGTVLAVSGVGLLVLSVKTALGVKDVRIVLQLFSKNLGSLTPYESKT